MSEPVPEPHTLTRCGVMVSAGITSYACTLPQGHTERGEPHYAVESTGAVRLWRKWRADQDRAEEFLERTGIAQVTHTDVPEDVFDVVTDDGRRVRVNLATGEQHFMEGTPSRTRPEDQPLPSGDVTIPDDQQLLIEDIEARRQVGIERYGQGHRPFNGRDTFLDAYEEMLDHLVYLRSLKRMAEATREELVEAVRKAFAETFPDQSLRDRQYSTQVATVAVDRVMGWVVGHLEDGGR